MPILEMKQRGKKYSTKEVLDKVEVARATLYKWLREGKISEVWRDRNNYRIFTEKDVKQILGYKNCLNKPTR